MWKRGTVSTCLHPVCSDIRDNHAHRNFSHAFRIAMACDCLKKCGLAATQSFETSKIDIETLHSLSTSTMKFVRVLKSELIRTRERKREGLDMAKAAVKSKVKAKAK